MIQHLRDIPLRWQLTLLNLAILLALLSGGGVLLYGEQRSFLRQSALLRLEAQSLPLIESRFERARGGPSRPPPVDPDAPRLTRQLRMRLGDLANELGTRDIAAQIVGPAGASIAVASGSPAPPPLNLALVLRAAATGQGQREVGGTMLVSYLPIGAGGRVLAVAQVAIGTEPIDAALARLAQTLLLGIGLALLLAAALGLAATRAVLRPLEGMAAVTQRVASGDLSQRVGLPPGRGEVARLAGAFDTMVARLEAVFGAQRRFVADAAHELRTPLTALSGSVELLRMGVDADDPQVTERLLRHLDTELTRLIRLTNDLLTLSALDSQPPVVRRPLELGPLLREVADQGRALLRGQELCCAAPEGLWVEGDADRVRQIVLNLLDNARKYTPASGSIELIAQRDGQWATIVVRDTGVGIPAEALAQVGERFYRVDSARARQAGGSGLGLAIVAALARAHGGQLAIASAPGVGTTATVRLPLRPAP